VAKGAKPSPSSLELSLKLMKSSLARLFGPLSAKLTVPTAQTPRPRAEVLSAPLRGMSKEGQGHTPGCSRRTGVAHDDWVILDGVVPEHLVERVVARDAPLHHEARRVAEERRVVVEAGLHLRHRGGRGGGGRGGIRPGCVERANAGGDIASVRRWTSRGAAAVGWGCAPVGGSGRHPWAPPPAKRSARWPPRRRHRC
jgi:hypothetical protein